jgi:GTP-binding protein HflX
MERQHDVETVLESIGADQIPAVRVFNKIDRVNEPPRVQRDEAGKAVSVSLSAVTGDGVEELRDAISEWLAAERINRWIELQGKDGKLRAQLFELGVVSEERIAENGSWMLHVDVPRETAERLGRLPGQEGAVARAQLLA